jgi:hypothetical protein
MIPGKKEGTSGSETLPVFPERKKRTFDLSKALWCGKQDLKSSESVRTVPSLFVKNTFPYETSLYIPS